MRHALVIGGGPAGSVAALLLARSGWGVTLVEQHRFPRDKVCGECLSALGAEVLARLGLFDQLLARRPVRLARAALHAPSGASVTTRLPRPMWGVSRVVLDELLLDAARREGVVVRQPARAESVEPGPRPVAGVRDLVTNVVDHVPADCVIVADGKAALLGGEGPPPPTGDLGLKAHFTGVDGPAGCIELFGTADCYGGLAPIEGGRWNAAFSVPAARVRDSRGDLDALFAQLVSENVTLARRLAGAARAGPWLAAPLPRFAVRRAWPRNVIPVGNAAAAIEPIGGEGMGLALRSAELAAEALTRPGPWQVHAADRLAAHYRKLWFPRGLACRAAARAVSSRRRADRFMPLVRAAPAALRPFLALMGK
jgi:2-polyprenyl-6-methoxyphenol hydroxylase-like FAD-dependent oxidoreductase